MQYKKNTRRGFTLIELLVVVLIIGILAAVAVPQYKKAVWRSRNAELKTLATAVGKAQKAYYLANSSWAGSFEQLDLDLPLEKGTKTCNNYTTPGTDTVRRGKNFEILLTGLDLQENGGNVTAVWTEGPYKCDGFLFRSKSNRLFCREEFPSHDTKFCTQVEQCTQKLPATGSVIYELP